MILKGSTENFAKRVSMLHFLNTFRTAEDGAVTVDWVVLTALVVGLAVAAFTGISNGSSGLALGIQSYLLSLLPGNF
jgi:hypothetical protein